MDNLISYIDSCDYLWLMDLDTEILNRGIYTDVNRYNNILIDLKNENILKELLYDYPISLLFKFRLIRNKFISHLTDVGSLDKFSNQLKRLDELGYITKYNLIEDLVDLGIWSNDLRTPPQYNGYLGNYDTYTAFKSLLTIYLNNISIFSYKDNYYSYKQFKEIYDITSFDHSKFCNDNFINNHSNVDDTLNDVIELNPEVTLITSKCIEVQNPGKVDSQGYILDPLANLKIIFKAPLEDNITKKRVSRSHKLIIMNLSDFL